MQKLFVTLILIASTALAQETTVVEMQDVVVRKSRLKIEDAATRTIPVDPASNTARPTLDTAVATQTEIQVVPTAKRGSNISLNGVGGEQVAVFQNGDPILGRIEGALDTKSVPLGSSDRIQIIQGLDSLPYGTQNIGGVIHLSAPWDLDNRLNLKAAGGNNQRSLIGGKASRRELFNVKGLAAEIGVNNWKNGAIQVSENPTALNPSTADTRVQSEAQVGAHAVVLKNGLATVGGKDIDLRMGSDGFYQNTKGIFGGQLNKGNRRRSHVFGDLNRGKSGLHFGYSEYFDRYQPLNNEGVPVTTDDYREKMVRVGPQIEEQAGRVTILAGSVVEAQTTTSSRTSSQGFTRTNLGSYAGSRVLVGENYLVGAGTRWDSSPKVLSPRAEIRRFFQTGSVDHTLMLETGYGYREAASKELFLSYINPALRYRVVGNPNLQTERAWLTALRQQAATKHLEVRTSVFQIRVRDAIGTDRIAGTGSEAVYTYRNLSRTKTLGAQTGFSYDLGTLGAWADGTKFTTSYQWLLGRNLETNSQLFLQPRHRASVGLARGGLEGLGMSLAALWTSKQGYEDLNRNGVIEDDEYTSPFWMAQAELGYGFKWKEIASLVRVFGRVDNAFNVVNPDTFPIEPRSFLLGAEVEL